MSNGVDIRASIDTETVRALQFVNGGAAAGLMTLLPAIAEKPGLKELAIGSMYGIAFSAGGLALAIVHNRLRRKCSLAHDNGGRGACWWAPRWVQSVPGDP